MRQSFSTLCTLLALAAAPALAAEDIKVYRADERVDPADVAAVLGAPIKYRSIRLLDDNVVVAPPKALSLPVQFSFDSADILPSARAQLDALAEGVRQLPKDRVVAIEGHTDARGSDEYNERLSMRRAQSVKRYLVSQHGIEPERLRAVGMGEYENLPGRDPNASENRRVQFRGDGPAARPTTL